MWCVGELGLEYRRIDRGHRFGGLDTDAFAALNPNRTVPVLKDGDGPALWETGAILRYLAAQYGDGTFWPRDAVQRAEVDKWAEWAKINVAMNFTGPVFWRVARTAPSARNPAVIRDAVETLEAALAIADARLASHQFLTGDAFTLGDIQLGHVLYRYYDIDIDRAPLGNLARYYDELTKRPAYREHVMISYAELQDF